MVKQRAESIDIYKKNNRTDLLEVEQNEYDILTGFLPKQLGEEETKKICGEIISKLGASSIKDMGKVMGIASSRLSGKADGKTISNIVRSKLS
ncbi:MAG: GatB/YqeY domain-containing protein [Flavobacteriaceae bacterium]